METETILMILKRNLHAIGYSVNGCPLTRSPCALTGCVNGLLGEHEINYFYRRHIQGLEKKITWISYFEWKILPYLRI